MHLPPALPLEIDYLAIGHPTIDEGTPQGDVIGGTVVYASVQAARLGWRAGFVGRAGADLAPLLAPFASEVEAYVQPSDRTTRFRNVAAGDARTQWVRAVAPPLDLLADRLGDRAGARAGGPAGDVAGRAGDVAGGRPAGRAGDEAVGRAGDVAVGRAGDVAGDVAGPAAGLRPTRPTGPLAPRVVHVAPVAQEVDLGAVAAVATGDVVGLTPQGLIRRWGKDGRVSLVPLTMGAGRDDVAAQVDVVVVAEDERPYVDALTAVVQGRGGLVVVTRGSLGCLVETAGGAQAVPALPVVEAVDRTGAGDVFAAALLVGLAEGRTVTDAIRFAMAAASCSIEGLGPAAIAGRVAIERRLAAAGQP